MSYSLYKLQTIFHFKIIIRFLDFTKKKYLWDLTILLLSGCIKILKKYLLNIPTAYLNKI